MSHPIPRTRFLQTPGPHRIFIAAGLLAIWPQVVQAADLTEAEVIRLARIGTPSAITARAQVSVASAGEVAAGLIANPVLSWTREQFAGAGPAGELEDALSLSMPVDFSGRRAAKHALVRADVAAAQANALRTESQAIMEALFIFYGALAAERRVAVAGQTVERLNEAARVMGRRHDEGTVSGYERARLELEVELAKSALRESEARAGVLLGELALLLDLDPSGLALSGELGASSVEPEDRARPSVELARSAAAEAKSARAHAGTAWLPPISLTAGIRRGQFDEVRYGYIAGIGLTLPFLSRGQELRAESEARGQLADAQAHASERAVRLATARATAELALAVRELARFEEGTTDRMERVERAAYSGYLEGQRSVIELLDAQRARATVELRRLELALAAKTAELALRAARGDFE